MDINAEDFVEKFDMTQGTVGLVGHGYVGQALERFFEKSTCRVLVYDKAKPELDTLPEVVGTSQVIFVAVPTPMMPSGECHTGIVRSVLVDIRAQADLLGRPQNEFIVVIKSTVPPGFTEEMQLAFPNMRLCFSPEFLTEKNSFRDFETQNRIIVGGDEQDALVVFKLFEAVAPQRVSDNELHLLQCDPTTAEMVKLYANGMLMTKVLFSNEMYLICQKLGVDYDDVRQLACLDHRIGVGHTMVPGPDGKLGAGGHCFPKDMNSLRFLASQLGTGELLFSAVLSRNDQVREERDWEKMEGRAVIS